MFDVRGPWEHSRFAIRTVNIHQFIRLLWINLCLETFWLRNKSSMNTIKGINYALCTERSVLRILSFEILDSVYVCVFVLPIAKGEISFDLREHWTNLTLVSVVFNLLWQKFGQSSFRRQFSTAYPVKTRMFDLISSFGRKQSNLLFYIFNELDSNSSAFARE